MNTKLHAICDSQGRPIDLFVTAGQVSDYIGARALLGGLPNVKWLPGDLPPFGPSFITRVCGFDLDNHGFRFGQARRARSPQIAQALGALAVASGFRATNAA